MTDRIADLPTLIKLTMLGDAKAAQDACAQFDKLFAALTAAQAENERLRAELSRYAGALQKFAHATGCTAGGDIVAWLDVALSRARDEQKEADAKRIIPLAILRLECQQMNPPKPVGFGAFVDGKMVAVLEYKNVKAALDQFEAAAIRAGDRKEKKE
jgi:hypothetical protein